MTDRTEPGCACGADMLVGETPEDHQRTAHGVAVDPYPLHTKLKKILNGTSAVETIFAALDSGEVKDQYGRTYVLKVDLEADQYGVPLYGPVNVERAQFDLLGIDYDAYQDEFDAMVKAIAQRSA